jgi:hypothetical protein
MWSLVIARHRHQRQNHPVRLQILYTIEKLAQLKRSASAKSKREQRRIE